MTPDPANLATIRSVLHQCFDPGLLHASYRKGWTAQNPSFGMCSIASEAAWFVLGGLTSGWKAMVTRDDDGTTHWWLEHGDGSRFDPTEEQYRSQGRLPPYERGLPGKGSGFMGIRQDLDGAWGDRKPSLRAQALLESMALRLGVSIEGAGSGQNLAGALRGAESKRRPKM